MDKKINMLISGKNVLITGGLGFIGHALTMRLKQNNRVFVIDNDLMKVGRKKLEKVTYFDLDVKNINEIQELKDIKFDYVFHFGEYSRVEQSLNEPDIAFQNIYNPLTAVLKFVKENGSKLVYSGSSTKFSEGGNGRALSPYTLAKAHNSETVLEYARWFKIRFVILYFYNVYGPSENSIGGYSTVIGKFLNIKNTTEEKLPITAPGTQRRNFTHIEDALNGIILAASKGEGDGYGIGSSDSYSIIEVAEMIGRDYRFLPFNDANRASGPVISDKLLKLGWKQKYTLPQYIREMVAK